MEPFPENVFDRPDMREKIHVFADCKRAGEILGSMRFAVADAYEYWSDVTEKELLELLKEGQDQTFR